MALDWLNYHHLHYFWVVAREGSLTRAAERLRLSPSTVSTQVRTLEDHLGVELFDRTGRALVLTPMGRVVADYADDIFALGRELADVVRHGPAGDRPIRLRVGVAGMLHKLVAYRLLAPALRLPGAPVHLVCKEDHAEALVAELALHHLDLVLADAPVGLARELSASSVLLGQCGVGLCGTPALVAAHAAGFPASLDGAPILLPVPGTPLRSALETWFEAHAVEPNVVAEFTDSALMKAFGREGAGLFPVPRLVEEEVVATYGVHALGPLEGVTERYYAVTMERRVEHRAIAAVIDAARASMGG